MWPPQPAQCHVLLMFGTKCEHEVHLERVARLLQLYINGEFVGGADIVEEMHSKGELKELLS